jgi:hypothetical protein
MAGRQHPTLVGGMGRQMERHLTAASPAGLLLAAHACSSKLEVLRDLSARLTGVDLSIEPPYALRAADGVLP